MVETNPTQPTPPGQPEQVKTLDAPSAVAEFDFVSFCITVFLVALFITGSLFGYRYLLQGRMLADQERQIAQLKAEISDPALQKIEKQMHDIAGGIDKIRPILDNPIRYAELFWTLRKVTEKSVRWNSLGFTEASELSLTGEAAGWGNVARQIAAFKQDERFSNVELISASLQASEGGIRVSFSLTAMVNPNKLVPPSQ